LGVQPKTEQEEQAIIENLLGGGLDWQNFILNNMKKDDIYYIVNKEFWDQWQNNIYSKSMLKCNFYSIQKGI